MKRRAELSRERRTFFATFGTNSKRINNLGIIYKKMRTKVGYDNTFLSVSPKLFSILSQNLESAL